MYGLGEREMSTFPDSFCQVFKFAKYPCSIVSFFLSPVESSESSLMGGEGSRSACQDEGWTRRGKQARAIY